MHSVLITVYITNYNYGKYIRQAIESVLHQTLQSFELVIIDDGSTDDSKIIIEEYRNHSNIKIIFQQNHGLNVTNNIALRVSNGKYIIRLDADDYFHPKALELLSAAMEKDPELGLIFPDYYLIDAEGSVTEEFRRHDFDSEVSLPDQAAHGACTMIRTEFLKNLGGYNESFSCQDGYEIWIKFIAHHKISNINQPLFYYRKHGNNLTRDETKILSTRAKINKLHSHNRFGQLDTLCIIPVRDEFLALQQLGNKKMIDYKIEEARQSKHISRIVISSPSDMVADYVHRKYGKSNNIIFHKRDEKYARLNVNLHDTVESILAIKKINHLGFKAIILLTIEFPFVKSYIIDDAVNTLFLFNSDSLLSVRQENTVFYQHYGNGMHPILNQDKFTRLEREAIYKVTGGISVVRSEVFEKYKQIVYGKIGHIMMDEVSSIGIFSDHEFTMAELFLKQTRTTQLSVDV
jgi:glycosyltransferase involved in cell wall biosynthesis